MMNARGMYWAISASTGIIATYGMIGSPTEHHTAHSTPVVAVNLCPSDPKTLFLKTASGNTWAVDADVDATTPGPGWRGLGTMLVQKQRKYALLKGEVIGPGRTMSLVERARYEAARSNA